MFFCRSRRNNFGFNAREAVYIRLQVADYTNYALIILTE